MLNMAQTANESLSKEVGTLQRRLSKADEEIRALRSGVEKTQNERNQLVAEVRKTKAAHELVVADFKEYKASQLTPEEQSAKATFMASVEHHRELTALRKGQEALAKELEASKELAAKQAEVLFRLREENQLAKEFLRVRGAFEVLRQSKAFDAEDVLRQLLEWK